MILLAVFVAAALIFVGYKTGIIGFGCAPASEEQADEGMIVPKAPQAGLLSAYFIDVGQGDSMLFVSPSGKTMLIDAGEVVYSRRVEKFLRQAGVDRIDLLIGTHAHSDHIGAMPYLIERFPVGAYVTTARNVESISSDMVSEALKEKRVSIAQVWCGDIIEWDDACRITVLSPVLGCEYSELDANDGCLILRVEYGETAFMLTADATVHAEQLAMFHNEKALFKADLLKVAHHGSTSSSSLGFVETVGAKTAVISVGADNLYGHPDADILRLLSGTGAEIYRTDERGSIAVFSNGSGLEFAFQKPQK